MASKRAKAPDKYRVLWAVEFEHSSGWVAYEGYLRRKDALDSVKRWAARSPAFRYRTQRYVPKKPPKKRKAKR